MLKLKNKLEFLVQLCWVISAVMSGKSSIVATIMGAFTQFMTSEGYGAPDTEDASWTSLQKDITKAVANAERKASARKNRDKNKPKRGKSAFMFFCADERPSVLNEMNEEIASSLGVTVDKLAKSERAKVTAASSRLGEMWRALKASQYSADKKRVQEYERLAAQDKDRFDEEMKHYVPEPGTVEARRSANKRDPRKPKAPLSAYNRFCRKYRPQAVRELQEAGNATPAPKEVMSHLGTMWSAFKDAAQEDDKCPQATQMKKWQKTIEKEKEVHARKMGEYRAMLAEEAGEDEAGEEETKRAPTSRRTSRKKKVHSEDEEKKTTRKSRGKGRAKRVVEDAEEEEEKAAVVEEEEEKPKRKSSGRKGKYKIPDHPGWKPFTEYRRPEVKEEHPDWSARKVTNQLIREWAEFDEADKNDWAEERDAGEEEGEETDLEA